MQATERPENCRPENCCRENTGQKLAATTARKKPVREELDAPAAEPVPEDDDLIDEDSRHRKQENEVKRSEDKLHQGVEVIAHVCASCP